MVVAAAVVADYYHDCDVPFMTNTSNDHHCRTLLPLPHTTATATHYCHCYTPHSPTPFPRPLSPPPPQCFAKQLRVPKREHTNGSIGVGDHHQF